MDQARWAGSLRLHNLPCLAASPPCLSFPAPTSPACCGRGPSSQSHLGKTTGSLPTRALPELGWGDSESLALAVFSLPFSLSLSLLPPRSAAALQRCRIPQSQPGGAGHLLRQPYWLGAGSGGQRLVPGGAAGAAGAGGGSAAQGVDHAKELAARLLLALPLPAQGATAGRARVAFLDQEQVDELGRLQGDSVESCCLKDMALSFCARGEAARAGAGGSHGVLRAQYPSQPQRARPCARSRRPLLRSSTSCAWWARRPPRRSSGTRCWRAAPSTGPKAPAGEPPRQEDTLCSDSRITDCTTPRNSFFKCEDRSQRREVK